MVFWNLIFLPVAVFLVVGGVEPPSTRASIPLPPDPSYRAKSRKVYFNDTHHLPSTVSSLKAQPRHQWSKFSIVHKL